MWLQQCISYLERLKGLDEGRLCRAAFDADVAHGLGWYDGLASKLRAHAVHLPRRGQECDLTKIAAAVQDKIIYKAMTPEPGNHLHQAYFSHKTEFRCEPYISKAKNKHLRKSIAMFRVGNHWLQVCRGRYVGLEYHQRTCPSCAGAIEDEVHAVFHCPDYNTQRQQFADLFTGQCGHDLRAFLVHNPCHRLALFLTACKSAERNSNMPRVQESMLTDTRYDGEPDVDLSVFLRASQIDNYDSD